MADNQGILDAIANPNIPTFITADGLSLTPQGPDDREPLSYNFGPGYAATAQRYPEDRTPIAPPIFNLGMGGGEEETPPEGALVFDQGAYIPTNWEDFKSRDRTTGGGFFTAADLFGETLPTSFQAGADRPSTNNWRLIPGGTPGVVMRNGQIIHLNDYNGIYGPFGAPSMGWYPPPWRSAASPAGPSAWSQGGAAYSIGGWPGSGVMSILGTPGY